MLFAPCVEVGAIRSMRNVRALLVLIAHHPPADHIRRLQACLHQLPSGCVYGLVVNDHRPGDAVEALVPEAAMAIVQRANPSCAFPMASASFSASATPPCWP